MLEPITKKDWNIFTAAHLLNRAGFGGNPETIAEAFRLGPTESVELLLQPGTTPALPEGVEFDQPTNLLARRQEIRAMVESEGITQEEARKRMQKMDNQDDREKMQALSSWWLGLMVQNVAPLREKMTLFWHGHFASSMQKVKDANLMYRQNALFRRHAMGNFGQLAKEITRDPAMMIYLDVQTSKDGMPNENFAREVMELFTLGEGNYSEEDIKDAARAFTGYRLNRTDRSFVFLPRQHDDGPKKVLGRSVDSGDDVVDAILGKPVCAEFMTRKMWRFFVGDHVPEDQVKALAGTFREANYEVAPMLRQLFLSREFYSNDVIRKQIKSPVQWMVNNAIIMGVDLPPARVLRQASNSLGQEIFFPPNVKGWDGGRAWINSSTLLQRYNLAGFFVGLNPGMDRKNANNKSPALQRLSDKYSRQAVMDPDLAEVAPAELRQDMVGLMQDLAFRLFQAPLQPRQAETFGKYWLESESQPSDDRVRGLIHLMMSTPDFQLC
jgi:uncharacterized protein (DUF1800 family)